MTEGERKKKLGLVARDGEIVRVPLMFLDAEQRAVAADYSYPIDMVGHRPGSLPLTDAQRRQREALYVTRDKMLVERWRNPRNTMPPDCLQATADGKAVAYADSQERLSKAWRQR